MNMNKEDHMTTLPKRGLKTSQYRVNGQDRSQKGLKDKSI